MNPAISRRIGKTFLAASLITLPALLCGAIGTVGASDQSPGGMIRPAAQVPLAATVLGEEVRTNDAGEMQEIILSRLFDRYAEQHGIEVTDAEINAFVEHLCCGMRAAGLTAEDELSPEEAAQAGKMRRDMGREWKLNRALYRQYCARIIFQQLGPEPLDAYRLYLQEWQAAGDFVIHEKAFDDAFWRYFTDDSIHSFYEAGSVAETQALERPPWEQSAVGD